jgi:hypothetical protein
MTGDIDRETFDAMITKDGGETTFSPF